MNDNLIAIVVKTAPFELGTEWSQKATQKTLHDWQSNRPDDFEHVMDHYDMYGMAIEYHVHASGRGPNGYPTDYDLYGRVDDEFVTEEMDRALAEELVEDWVGRIHDNVREYQASTTLSEKEFTAAVALSHPRWPEAEVADAIGVSVGNLRGKNGRVSDKFEKAQQTSEMASLVDSDRRAKLHGGVKRAQASFTDLLEVTEGEFPVNCRVEASQSYENEHSGVWGTESVSWTCSDCGTRLQSPSDFDLVDGEEICNGCRGC